MPLRALRGEKPPSQSVARGPSRRCSQIHGPGSFVRQFENCVRQPAAERLVVAELFEEFRVVAQVERLGRLRLRRAQESREVRKVHAVLPVVVGGIAAEISRAAIGSRRLGNALARTRCRSAPRRSGARALSRWCRSSCRTFNQVPIKYSKLLILNNCRSGDPYPKPGPSSTVFSLWGRP